VRVVNENETERVDSRVHEDVGVVVTGVHHVPNEGSHVPLAQELPAPTRGRPDAGSVAPTAPGTPRRRRRGRSRGHRVPGTDLDPFRRADVGDLRPVQRRREIDEVCTPMSGHID
jgi:hypothetical protein